MCVITLSLFLIFLSYIMSSYHLFKWQVNKYPCVRLFKSLFLIFLPHSSLEWWKENSNKYSLLAKIAIEFLCISPTSTPSERLISTAGRIISEKRFNLLPAQDLIMNRNNLPELESDIKTGICAGKTIQN